MLCAPTSESAATYALLLDATDEMRVWSLMWSLEPLGNRPTSWLVAGQQGSHPRSLDDFGEFAGNTDPFPDSHFRYGHRF